MKIAVRKDLIENEYQNITDQENLMNKYNVLLNSIKVLIENDVIAYDMNKINIYSDKIENINDLVEELYDGKRVVMLINYKYFKYLFKMLLGDEKEEKESNLYFYSDCFNIDNIIQQINENFGDAEKGDKYITYELMNKNKYSKKIYKYINKLIKKGV